MSQRGRIIFPVLAALRRLDTNATELAIAQPDTGYDERFRAPRVSYPQGADGGRSSTRRELAEVRVRCQVEPFAEDRQQQAPQGNVPQANILLAFHFSDLEGAGLIDTATGEPMIRVNDRLAGFYHYRTGAMIRTFRNPPGMYVTEVRGQSYGLTGLHRNLLMVNFDDRPQGPTAAS